jgi:hypothetical protein
MNRNLIFASLALAVAVNISIISCHRKGDNESNVHVDSAKVQAAMNDSATTAAVPEKNPYEGSVVEVRTFKNDAVLTGYGYDIYVDNSLKVHQPHIPAVSGNKGFSSEEKAKRAGEFVGNKFRHNIMPPSVSPKELDSLGVL